jgi:hypothetical protein
MWNFAGMCVNADQGRLRISLGAIGDQTLAGFLPVLPLDTPVRSRGSCGTLTAMKPQQSSVSAAGPGGHLKIPRPWPGQNPPPGGGGTIDDYAV